MPLFKIKSPGNVNTFNRFFIDMVQFSFVIDMETVTSDLFYFPEDEPYSFSFMQAGFDSTFMIPGM